MENLHEEDSHSSESDSESDSSAVSFKYPPAFKELLKRVDKFSGKSDENDFEVWLVDFTEATNDCMWKDVERARWFSWFLAGSAKVTWQKTVKPEDKTFWNTIVEIFSDHMVFTWTPELLTNAAMTYNMILLVLSKVSLN